MDKEIMLKFIDEVISKSGLELPDDFKTDYQERMLSNLQKKIWLLMISELDDAKLKKFVELTDGISDPENIGDKKNIDILEFFKNNIEDFEIKILKAMDAFGNDFISDVVALKDSTL
ncbi:MAG: hypothetical protein V1655_01695 [bacterium]